MKNVQGQHRFSKSSKIYYFLPLAVLPFTTLLFWALGGGGSAEATELGGLNTSLPAAKMKEATGFNKLSFYERALGEEEKPIPQKDSTLVDPVQTFSYDPSPQSFPGYKYEEEELSRKLETLGQNLKSSERKKASHQNPRVSNSSALAKEEPFTTSEDKELTAINELMDKVIRIQNPAAGKGVSDIKRKDKQKDNLTITLLQREENKLSQKSFFGIANETEEEESGDEGRTVAVAVDGDQSIGGGSTIKLRLKEELTVRGKRILPGTILWGLTSISGDRMSIQVRSIRSENDIISLSGTICDEDGLPGIRMPRSFGENMGSQGGNNLFDLDSYLLQDASVRSRVTQVGIESLKNLVKKGSKQQKIKVPAGYSLYLQFKD